MRRLFGALATAVLLATLVAPQAYAAPGDRSISLSASKFDFVAEGGQDAVGTVWVTNEGAAPVSVRVYSANQSIDASGVAQYQAPPVDANVLQSPASWVTVMLPKDAKAVGNVPYVDMKPGQRVKVDFRVKVPEGAVPGDHNILLFFEMFSPPGTTGTGSTSVAGRLGARVKARVAGDIVEKMDVAPFAMPAWVLGASVPYSMTIKNEGNLDERASARLIQLDANDTEIASTDVATDQPVYANSSIPKKGVVVSNGYGKQRFKLVMSYPSADASAGGLVKTVEKERQVWVLPAWLPWAIIVPLVILVVLVIWGVGRRSGRRKAARSQAPPVAPRF